ncbi:MAG: Ig-like domain-containing protein [Bacteroidales bacterium]|nr:Ig-like domain-containing protein [Bacteroidales bacterium]
MTIHPSPTITISPNSALMMTGEILPMYVSGDTTSPFIWTVEDELVASIDGDGFLTAVGPGKTKVIVSDDKGLTDESNDFIEVRGYKLSIPNDLSEWQGGEIDIPVYTTDQSALDVLSGSLRLTYNQNILEPTEIVLNGTLLEGHETPEVIINNGSVDIAFAISSPLSGEGILFYLRCNVSAINTGATSISFSNVLFNEDLFAICTNGYFNTINFADISISPNTASLIAGDSLQFTASSGVIPYTWDTENHEVATIDSTGLLHTYRSGIIHVLVQDSVGASKTSGIIEVIDTEVFLPDTTGPVNATFDLPVYVKDLPIGQSISSIEAKFSFRSPELEFGEIITTGSLSDGWTAADATNANTCEFALAGSSGFNSVGILFYLRFNLTADLTLGENAYVSINEMLLNEGTPSTTTKNGSITGTKSENLGVSLINNPVSNCNLTSSEVVSISVYNYGYITYSAGDTIVVGYQLDSNTPVVDSIFLSADFAPATSIDFTFESSIDLSAIGVYSLKAHTLLSSEIDGNPSNDQLIASVENYDKLPIDLGMDQTVCEGDVFVLDAGSGFDSYLWSNAGSETNLLEVTTSGEYSVLVSNGEGCDGRDTVSIIFNPIPIVTIGNDTSFCQGDLLEIDAGPGYTSYNWNNGVSSSQTMTVETAGSYYVEVLDEYGCTGSDFIMVSILPAPITDLGENLSFCFGEEMLVSAETGYESYYWSTGEITEAITVSESGTYIVEVGGANGCITKDTIEALVEHFDIDLGGDISLCSDVNYTIEAPIGDYTYAWSDGITTTNSLPISTTGTYSVIVTDNTSGCIGKDTVQATFSDVLTVNLGADIEVCGNDPISLFAGNGYDTYTWSNGASTTKYLEVIEAGTYSVSVTSSTCSGADTINVAYHPLPVLDLGTDITSCEGNDVILVAPTGFETYNWNNGVSLNDSLHVSSSGEYTLEVSNTEGCGASDTIQVDFSPTPIASISGNQSICEGESVEVTASGGTSYLWSTGELSSSISVTPLETTVYSVTVTENGCADSTDVTVSVIETHYHLDIVTLCEGDSILFDGSYIKEAGDYSETYTSYLGCDSTMELSLSLSRAVSSTASETICFGETYTFGSQTLTETGEYTEVFEAANGCDSTVTLTLTVNEAISSTAEAATCAGDSYTFGSQTLTDQGDYTEVFEASNGCDSTVTLTLDVNPVYEFNETETLCAGETLTWQGEDYTASGDYTAVYTSMATCDSSYNLNLTVFELPETPVITLDDRTLSSSASEGNQWHLDDTEVSGAVSQTYTAVEEGDYFVLVTDEHGCVSAQSNIITVEFTGLSLFESWNIEVYPNPASDKLFIENHSGKELRLEIFEVTGKMIFNTILTGELETIDVQNITPSIYFFKISIDDSSQLQKIIIQ